MLRLSLSTTACALAALLLGPAVTGQDPQDPPAGTGAGETTAEAPLTRAEADAIRADQERIARVLEATTERLDRLLELARGNLILPEPAVPAAARAVTPTSRALEADAEAEPQPAPAASAAAPAHEEPAAERPTAEEPTAERPIAAETPTSPADEGAAAARVAPATPPATAPQESALPSPWILGLLGWNVVLTLLLLVHMLSSRRRHAEALAAASAAQPYAAPGLPAARPTLSPVDAEDGVGDEELVDFGDDGELFLLADDETAAQFRG